MPLDAMTIPIVGRGGEGKFAMEAFSIWYSPNTFRLDEPLKTIAVRCIDQMVAEGGKAEARHYLAAKWLRMKGYIRPVEFYKYHWCFGSVIDEVTEAGAEFHRRYAAPMGEW